MDDYISKPVKLEELGRMLQKTLSTSGKGRKTNHRWNLRSFPSADRAELVAVSSGFPVHEGPSKL